MTERTFLFSTRFSRHVYICREKRAHAVPTPRQETPLVSAAPRIGMANTVGRSFARCHPMPPDAPVACHAIPETSSAAERSFFFSGNQFATLVSGCRCARRCTNNVGIRSLKGMHGIRTLAVLTDDVVGMLWTPGGQRHATRCPNNVGTMAGVRTAGLRATLSLVRKIC